MTARSRASGTSLLARALHQPSYGFADAHGALVVPTRRQILGEFVRRINVATSPKNWLVAATWFFTVALVPFVVVFFTREFAWRWVPVIPLYAGAMGAAATVWLHRYGTHRAYRFRSRLARFITRNLVIKVIPEELYIVSHHVHHALVEAPGDPYNARAGKLYCFLADANHQAIARDLSERDYHRVSRLVDHLGMHCNTYAQYQRWGSIAHPAWALLHYAANWSFWYGVCWLLGGHGLACAAFAGALWWSIGIRMFNYHGHGGGVARHRDGVDFHRGDLSINNQFPDGLLAGEYHNNHHLFPRSARSGFLPGQLDLPWLYIRGLAAIGAVSSYRDDTDAFYQRYYLPYLERVDPERAGRLRSRRASL